MNPEYYFPKDGQDFPCVVRVESVAAITNPERLANMNGKKIDRAGYHEGRERSYRAHGKQKGAGSRVALRAFARTPAVSVIHVTDRERRLVWGPAGKLP